MTTTTNQIRCDIASIMADGRERTVSDLMCAVKTKNRTAVQDAIVFMVNMGILTREFIKTSNTPVYRRKKE